MDILNKTYNIQILVGSEDKGENWGYTCCKGSKAQKKELLVSEQYE
jgi:hypothetical protein